MYSAIHLSGSGKKVLFLLLVLVFIDFTAGVTPLQDFQRRFGTVHGLNMTVSPASTRAIIPHTTSPQNTSITRAINQPPPKPTHHSRAHPSAIVVSASAPTKPQTTSPAMRRAKITPPAINRPFDCSTHTFSLSPSPLFSFRLFSLRYPT